MATALPVLCCRPLTSEPLSQAEADATAGLLKALADPARLRLLNMLANSGHAVCVCELTEPLGLSQPTVSHHLKKLTAAGLLHRQQRGVWAYYSLNREALAEVASLLDPKEER